MIMLVKIMIIDDHNVKCQLKPFLSGSENHNDTNMVTFVICKY